MDFSYFLVALSFLSVLVIPNSANDKEVGSNLLTLPNELLEDICKYLNQRDLCTSQLVCTRLRDVAMEILRKKPLLHQVKITNLEQKQNNKHLREQECEIPIKPEVVLFFSDETAPRRVRNRMVYDSLASELFIHHRNQLTPTTIMVHFWENSVFKNKDKIKGDDNEALGLFLSEMENLRIKVDAIRDNDLLLKNYADSHVVDQIFKELKPTPGHTDRNPYGLMVFNTINIIFKDKSSYPQKVMDKVKKMHAKDKNFALWGYSSFNFISIGNSAYDRLPVSSLLTSISGADVRCWSLLIDKSNSKEEKLEKMKYFKGEIDIIPSKSVVLSLYNTKASEKDELIEENIMLGNIFKGVQMGSFSTVWKKLYCIDSMNEVSDKEQQIEFEGDQFICYLFISYT